MKVGYLATVALLSGATGTASHAEASQVSGSESTVQKRYEAAVALMGAGEYESAIEALQKIITDYPDFPPAYRSLERSHVILEDTPGARAFFAERLEIAPDNAYAHHALGRVISSLSVPAELRGDVGDAIAHMQRSIALDPLFAPAYRDLAYFHRKKGTTGNARAFFQDRLSDTSAGARAYYGLGYLYSLEYRPDDALRALGRAVALDEELTLAHSARIAVYGETGAYAEVLSAATRLLEIAERQNEPDSEGYAHRALGMGHLYQGDFWAALHHLNESLQLARRAGEKFNEGAALTAIGNLYITLGEPERALESYRAAYELSKAIKWHEGEAIDLSNIGHALTEVGRAAESLEYFRRALMIAETETTRGYDESNFLLNMASAHEDLGESERAVAEYLEALGLARQRHNRSSEGAILRDLGKIEMDRGRVADAAEYFQQALAVGEHTGDVDFLWQAHGGLGRVYERTSETARAISHYTEAVNLYEQARSVGVESMGSRFLDYYANVYPSLIRLLAHAGRVEEAFDYAQEYKATSLLQVVSEGRNLADDLLPEPYRGRLAELRSSLESAHAALSQERSRTESDSGEIERLEREVSDLEVQKAALLEGIRRDEGAYFQLTASEPATLQTIRSRILPAGGAMIDYIVGEETLSAFVVTQDELRYHELPVAAEDLPEMLAALSPVFDKDKDVDESSRALVFGPELADFSIPPARTLYEILVEPLVPTIAHRRELIIVPDGLLHYLPFETLVTDAASARHPYDFENATFLLERYAVSYAASASLLDPNLQRPRSAERGLLAFGNPDFTRDENDRLPEAFYVSALTYSGGVVRGDELLPLPAAELEVAAIEESLGTESRVYVGREATEAAFRQEAGNYSILHFATHFLNDDRQPLYSKIVLSRGDDIEQDGYLQTYEIFNTRLNADLVVLSACSTGLGKLSEGEGLAGISRAFLYAGVPSLVVSLWSVEDEATARIMERFYRHLRAGSMKNAALRRAKLDYLRSVRGGKRDPFYWAPFVLLGDTQPMSLPSAQFHYWFLAPILALAVSAWYLVRRKWENARPSDDPSRDTTPIGQPPIRPRSR